MRRHSGVRLIPVQSPSPAQTSPEGAKYPGAHRHFAWSVIDPDAANGCRPRRGRTGRRRAGAAADWRRYPTRAGRARVTHRPALAGGADDSSGRPLRVRRTRCHRPPGAGLPLGTRLNRRPACWQAAARRPARHACRGTPRASPARHRQAQQVRRHQAQRAQGPPDGRRGATRTSGRRTTQSTRGRPAAVGAAAGGRWRQRRARHDRQLTLHRDVPVHPLVDVSGIGEPVFAGHVEGAPERLAG